MSPGGHLQIVITEERPGYFRSYCIGTCSQVQTYRYSPLAAIRSRLAVPRNWVPVTTGRPVLSCKRLTHLPALSRSEPFRQFHSAGEKAHPDNGHAYAADGKAADYPGGRSISRSRLERT